jgi:hypothetical protein
VQAGQAGWRRRASACSVQGTFEEEVEECGKRGMRGGHSSTALRYTKQSVSTPQI